MSRARPPEAGRYRHNGAALSLHDREDLRAKGGERASAWPWWVAFERVRAYMRECERTFWLLLDLTPKEWVVLFPLEDALRDDAGIRPLGEVWDETLTCDRGRLMPTDWYGRVSRAHDAATRLWRGMFKGTTARFSGQEHLRTFAVRERLEALDRHGRDVVGSMDATREAFWRLPADDVVAWTRGYPEHWSDTNSRGHHDRLACLAALAFRERSVEPDRTQLSLLPQDGFLPPPCTRGKEPDFREVLLDFVWAGGVVQRCRGRYDDMPWPQGGPMLTPSGADVGDDEAGQITHLAAMEMPGDMARGPGRAVFRALSSIAPAVLAFHLALPRARRWLMVVLRKQGLTPREVNMKLYQGPLQHASQQRKILLQAALAQRPGGPTADQLRERVREAWTRGRDEARSAIGDG